MSKPGAHVHTHYENLKVERTATREQIRLAYKRLASAHHPDRNPGNPHAERKMALINEAYSVLSDEFRRRAHDRWIAEQEINIPTVRNKSIPRQDKKRPTPKQGGILVPIGPFIVGAGCSLGVIAGLIYAIIK